ncbi:ribulose phosphate epimerase [Nannocystis bainbridge]|uniref:Ribulose phosphate epimerase n=1 Tax=Nannocystis bainbridge TaxID=2995303 RepID=A0ABT5E5T2_9BACT|nr:ribulose phosphate epimerase [Nannocystis bainbridge]MDC0720121.1 ribulose phosphate epimerase [Nannocystis bainbridge]
MLYRPSCLVLLALAACVARPTGDTDGGLTTSTSEPGLPGSTTETPGTTTSPGTTAGPGTATVPVPTTDAPDTATGGEPDPSGEPSTTVPFIPVPDFFNPPECDPWVEDCPPGQKCMPFANDGGSSWNSTKCVDIVPDPDGLDEPCTVVDSGVSGEDSCDKHLQCFFVDPDTLQGTCVAMCTGSPDNPGCAQPDATCMLSGDGVLILCLPDCDPLEPGCKPGEVCVPNWTSTFTCTIDASGEEGQVFDPCEFLNACDPGLVCLSPDLAEECDPASQGCCLPFCDLTAPLSCPGQGQECVPYFEQGQAPPGHEDLGVCGLPQP